MTFLLKTLFFTRYIEVTAGIIYEISLKKGKYYILYKIAHPATTTEQLCMVVFIFAPPTLNRDNNRQGVKNSPHFTARPPSLSLMIRFVNDCGAPSPLSRDLLPLLISFRPATV